MRKHSALAACLGLLVACQAQSPGVADLVQARADRYLKAWQDADWATIYQLEGREPDKRSVFHRALTDRLEFYHINELRYADSAVACAVTLRWRTVSGTYSETGELYLERHGTDWMVSGYRNF